MNTSFTLIFAAAGIVLFSLMLAVVSASEQVFLSLTEAQLRRLKALGNGRTGRVMEFVRRPHRVVRTTSLSSGVFFAGAILCLLLLVSRGEAVTPRHIMGPGLIGGLLLAILFRSLPRALASARPATVAFHLVPLFSIVDMFFGPLTWLVHRVLERISDEAAEDLVAAAEFKAVAANDEEAPRLEDEKRELMHSIFEFGGTTAKEVMVPRIDMVMAEAGTPRSEVLHMISEHGHSRIPVFDESVDKILGAVHVKELVKNGQSGSDDHPIREFVKPVMFVPETKKIDELMREFQDKKTHLAIVVDEYGGTSGMVTLEDVLEEIVGEIEDEYDHEETLFERLEDGSYRVAAKIDIDDLNEEADLQLPTENSDTLGGFIYELIGKVPSQGDEVDYRGFTFTIDRIHRQRIVRVRIRPKTKARA